MKKISEWKKPRAPSKLLSTAGIIGAICYLIAGIVGFVIYSPYYQVFLWVYLLISSGLILFGSFTYIILKWRINLKPTKATWRSIYAICIIGVLAGSVSIFTFIPRARSWFYREPSYMEFETKPWLSYLTYDDPASDISVNWKTLAPENSTVIFGLESSNLNLTVDSSEVVEWHHVKLSNLKSNTTYYYQIKNHESWGTHSFRTAPPSDSNQNFSVLLFSDPRQNSGDTSVQPNVPKYMEDAMIAEGKQQALTISAGDIAESATNYPTWNSFFDDISNTSNLASEAPIINTAGNHERHYDPNGDIYEEIWGLERDIGGGNANAFYYSLNYSYLHILSLDPWDLNRLGRDPHARWGNLKTEQIEWMDRDLQNSQDMTFKIIVLHPPPASANGPIQTTNVFEKVNEMNEKYGIDAVFFGHAHRFWHIEINGVHYFNFGIGGNTSNDFEETGFGILDFTPENLAIRLRMVNGTESQLANIAA